MSEQDYQENYSDEVKYMVCSWCATIIAVTTRDVIFDIYDCSWKCPKCGILWLSSDHWETIGNLIIPYRC